LQRILRYLLPLTLLVAMLALAACGGDDNGGGGSGTVAGGEPVSSDADPNEILEKTFSGEDRKIDSGKFGLNVEANITGDESLSGPIKLTVSGPFQSEGEKKLPKFDIDLAAEAQGQSIEAGLTSTGDKGFIALKLPGDDSVTEYAVTDDVFQQFKSGFEQAQAQGGENAMSFSDLGIDPRNWLTDPKVEGDSEVEGTETVKITGGVDVAKFLADINTTLQKAGESGLTGATPLPTELTEEQIAEVEKSIKDVSVEIETGKDDSILRRLAVTLSAEDPNDSASKADVSFEITLSGLNEDQTIEEPSDAKPFEELLPKLGGLGGLGALGGLGGGASTDDGSSSGGGVSSDAAEQYTQCIADAGSDTAAAQECAALLG
jgi:hypothetical protein